MHELPDLEIGTARCAPFHAAQGVDPIGSASAHDAFLCVEVPGRWQKDMSLHEPYVTLLDGAKQLVGDDGRRWRPQGLRCDATASRRTVLAFDRPATPSPPDGQRATAGGQRGGAYRRRQWSVAPDEVLELCRQLLCDGGEAPGFDDRRLAVPAGTVDLLVCTHGGRDVCCGSLGTALQSELDTMLSSERATSSEADGADNGPDNERADNARADNALVRTWRTSHTGGHRFAPTALTFPDGYAWAHLDVPLAKLLVQRDAPLDQLLPHCRGSSSLSGGPAQTADRAVLESVGRDLLAAERTVAVASFDRETMDTTVLVDARWPDGSSADFEVVVGVQRHVPQITCGALAEPEYSVEAVWSVASFAVLEPRS